MADDFDFDFTDDDAPKRHARPCPPDRAAHVVFVIPRPGKHAEIFVETPDGLRLDELGLDAQEQETMIAQAYIGFRAVFSDDMRSRLDRAVHPKFPRPVMHGDHVWPLLRGH